MRITVLAGLVVISSTLTYSQGRFIPKRAEDDIRFVQFKNDTLSFVTCGNHFFEPFGKINSLPDLRRPEFHKFTLDSIARDEDTFYQLSTSSSYFIIYLFAGGGERPVYLLNGEILQGDIIIQPGIFIGMTKLEFFDVFFTHYPSKWKEIKAVVFQSCLGGNTQTFTFQSNSLRKVNFDCLDCISKFRFNGRVAG